MITRLLRSSGIVAVLLFLLLSTCAAATVKQRNGAPSAPGHSEQPGRFQVLPVEYEVQYATGKSLKKGLLKIDTATGRTWLYLESYTKQENGGVIAGTGWSEVKDFTLSLIGKPEEIAPASQETPALQEEPAPQEAPAPQEEPAPQEAPALQEEPAPPSE